LPVVARQMRDYNGARGFAVLSLIAADEAAANRKPCHPHQGRSTTDEKPSHIEALAQRETTPNQSLMRCDSRGIESASVRS
jgi:hypothetical protein